MDEREVIPKRKKKPEIVHRKPELDREVARLLGMKQQAVTPITNEFIRAIVRHLVQLEIVGLDGLGELRVNVTKPIKSVNLRQGRVKGEYRDATYSNVRKYRVGFKKATPLKLAIQAFHGAAVQEQVMEKFGVDEGGEEQEKRAAAGCPNCGAKVEKHGNVLACPTCGTEPWERSQGEKTRSK